MPLTGWDDGEYGSGSSIGRPKARTTLQERAFAATGRKTWLDTKERKRFEYHEDRARGSSAESFLHQMWIVHNIEIAEKANTLSRVRSLGNILAMLDNDAREMEWKAANREKLLNERGKATLDAFARAAEYAREKRNVEEEE
jgi:hypothetical protein